MDDDTGLMHKAARGDQSAFTALVERYRVSSVNFAYRFIGDRQTAEDLAQEAFIRAYQSRHRYRPIATFATWFFRILTNLCLNEIRRRTRQGVGLELEDSQTTATIDQPASPSVRYEQQELQMAVQRALADLPEKQRLAVILQRFEGMNYVAIGQVMGMSRGAVDGLLSRAKESLRQQLADYFNV